MTDDWNWATGKPGPPSKNDARLQALQQEDPKPDLHGRESLGTRSLGSESVTSLMDSKRRPK